MIKNIDVNMNPTPDQLAMLAHAAELDIPADSEYPEFSEEELNQFKRISELHKSERQKQTVTLRLSPRALTKARSLGKGYTSVLSRILESTLENSELLKNFL